MMRITALLLALCVMNARACENSYGPLFHIIDSVYKVERLQEPRLVYNFIPVDFCPFFCFDTSFLKNSETIYMLCDGATVKRQETKNSERIMVAVLSYRKPVNDECPYTKFYRLFFYYRNPMTDEWLEGRPRVTMTMKLRNVGHCEYECSSLK